MYLDNLFDKYELLLPSKHEGGYLIVYLYEKIKSGEISEQFTITDIKDSLSEISRKFQETTPQSERLLKNLLHYFIRNHGDTPGKYYLTDYAKNVVELMQNKLDNPYKNFPLKKNFEEKFTIRFNQIKTIDDLVGRFGRIFIEGPKKIINDHLEALEDELQDAYTQLNSILRSDEEDATVLVKSFASVFKKFGEKAEDITNAIISKDKFLRDLQTVVDNYYSQIINFKSDDNNATEDLMQLKNDWTTAKDIYWDIESFFKDIDNKTSNIRRRIIKASEKLSELHEHFSARAHLRLKLKQLLKIALESTVYDDDGAKFVNNFPIKTLVYEQTRLLFPEYHNFRTSSLNEIVLPPADTDYEQQRRKEVEKEIKKQQIINEWITKIKEMLRAKKIISLNELISIITEQESDVFIAYQVVTEIVGFASEQSNLQIDIERQLISLKQAPLHLWKTELSNMEITLS
ncbi:MAG: hypothetical protein BGO69_18875 [Bacteroidetes bacterium 46-16]|nr:MAG: hypothetical protein BGO69_18875 [Bacteroidetes bacterium 46-16]